MYWHLWTVAHLCGIGVPGLLIIAAAMYIAIYSALQTVYYFALRNVS
jgi:hypothetical protein